MNASTATSTTTEPGHPVETISRIVVGLNGYPEGLDAAALGAALSRATGASMVLAAVHPDPMIVLPEGLDWKSLHRQARDTLIKARDAYAPSARLAVMTDHSVARALLGMVTSDHRDLLVMGSSRHAAPGQVRIGKRTRQLLCNFECAIAIAPRGLHARRDLDFERIGVGYDGTPESTAALEWAGGVAAAAGAELLVRGVVDDRMPTVGWGEVWIGDIRSDWMDVVQEEKASLRNEAQAAARRAGVRAHAEALAGRPADALAALSGEVELLVIGSRRWGPVNRVLLGSTGEALMHDAKCAVVAVPRPGTEK